MYCAPKSKSRESILHSIREARRSMLFISPDPKRGPGRIHLEPSNSFFEEEDKLKARITDGLLLVAKKK